MTESCVVKYHRLMMRKERKQLTEELLADAQLQALTIPEFTKLQSSLITIICQNAG